MNLYVVMPVVNCLDFTKQAFESIGSKCNYILIDNSSNDGTKEWGRQNDTFEVKRHAHALVQDFIYTRNDAGLGVAASWNQGVKRAFEDKECEYVAILNNDIILHQKTLEHLMRFMDKTNYLLVTGDNIRDRMSPEVMKSMELPEPYTDFDCQEISDWRAEGPDFSCFMVNRNTIKTIGWFDENFQGAYCEDWDYHARINRAWRWGKQYGIPDPKVTHAKRLSTAPYYHFASQSLKWNIPLRHEISMKHAHNREYYMRKWGGDHPFVMDGGGNITPFGDATKNWTHV